MPLISALWFNFAIVLIGVRSLHMPGVWLGDPAFYWSGDRHTSAAVQSALPSVIYRILPDLVTGAFENSFFITQFFSA